jgi:hypothetical protein
VSVDPTGIRQCLTTVRHLSGTLGIFRAFLVVKF